MSDQYYSEFERFLDGGSTRKPTNPLASYGSWHPQSTSVSQHYSARSTGVNPTAAISRSAPQDQFTWDALTGSGVEAHAPLENSFATSSGLPSEPSWDDSRHGSPSSSNSSESSIAGAMDIPTSSGAASYGNPAPTSTPVGSLIVPRNPRAYASRPSSSSSSRLVAAVPSPQDFFLPQPTEVFKRLSIDDHAESSGMFAFALPSNSAQSPHAIPETSSDDIWSSTFTSASMHPQSMLRGSPSSSTHEAFTPHHQRSSSHPLQRQSLMVPAHMFPSRAPVRPASQNSVSSAQSWVTIPQANPPIPQRSQNMTMHAAPEPYSYMAPDQPSFSLPTNFYYQPLLPQTDFGNMTPGSQSVASPGFWGGVSESESAYSPGQTDIRLDEPVASLQSPPQGHGGPSPQAEGSRSGHVGTTSTPAFTLAPPIQDEIQRGPSGVVSGSPELKIVQYDSRIPRADPNLSNPSGRKRVNPGMSQSNPRHLPGTFTFVGGPSRKAALLSMAADSTRGTKRASPDAADDYAKTTKRRARSKSDVGGAEGVFQTYNASGAPVSSPMGLTSAFTSMFNHLHIINIPCPHPDCSFTAAVNDSSERNLLLAQQGRKKGRAPKPYSCPYINPVNGGTCQSAFRRRGCRDRHGGSHAGKESKDVSNNILNMSLARRLLWETCRVVETADWGCLYLDNQVESTGQVERVKSQIASGEISSHQAAASVFVSRDEARRRIEVEYDVNALQKQAEGVKKALIEQGELEVTRSSEGVPPPGFAIRPVDLSLFPLFKRMAMKRAATYERYFCPEKNCEVDFTRLDALLRHSKNSHGAGGKKIRGGSSKSRPLFPGAAASKRKSNKRKKRGDDSDDDSDEDEEDEWGSKRGETSEPDSEGDPR